MIFKLSVQGDVAIGGTHALRTRSHNRDDDGDGFVGDSMENV